MKKAILIGNGFTSQLIEEYSDLNMKNKLLHFFSKEYYYINTLFENFRISNYTNKEVYKYDGGLKCSNNLFPSEKLFLQPDRILYNNTIREHVVKTLQDFGFKNHNEIFDIYFVQYGLIFEVIKNEINSVESLLKIINMFKIIEKTNEEMEVQLKKVANKIYYNEGKNGLKDTNLKDIKKIKGFFLEFDYVFTTNYDLILDDICENRDKVFHLHGGFNMEHRNLKAIKRLTDEEAYLVWGISGDEKYQELSPGLDFTDFRYDAVSFGQSLLANYFSYLEEYEYHELHIFGFSGENDQHINKKIVNNKSIKQVFFYCDPLDEVNDYNFKCKIHDFFKGTKANISLEPWSKIWQSIKG